MKRDADPPGGAAAAKLPALSARASLKHALESEEETLLDRTSRA